MRPLSWGGAQTEKIPNFIYHLVYFSDSMDEYRQLSIREFVVSSLSKTDRRQVMGQTNQTEDLIQARANSLATVYWPDKTDWRLDMDQTKPYHEALKNIFHRILIVGNFSALPLENFSALSSECCEKILKAPNCGEKFNAGRTKIHRNIFFILLEPAPKPDFVNDTCANFLVCYLLTQTFCLFNIFAIEIIGNLRKKI